MTMERDEKTKGDELPRPEQIKKERRVKAQQKWKNMVPIPFRLSIR